jgi:hypothetical protein
MNVNGHTAVTGKVDLDLIVTPEVAQIQMLLQYLGHIVHFTGAESVPPQNVGQRFVPADTVRYHEPRFWLRQGIFRMRRMRRIRRELA